MRGSSWPMMSCFRRHLTFVILIVAMLSILPASIGCGPLPARQAAAESRTLDPGAARSHSSTRNLEGKRNMTSSRDVPGCDRGKTKRLLVAARGRCVLGRVAGVIVFVPESDAPEGGGARDAQQ